MNLLKSIIVAARSPAGFKLRHSRMGFGWVAGVNPIDISFDRAPVGSPATHYMLIELPQESA